MLIAALSATSAAACGASLNAVYEGDVRFEHCMALDEGTGDSVEERKSCWDEWVKYYTFGQTRDRVDYARRRRRELTSGDKDPAGFASPAVAQRIVPAPTTVLEPPPPTLGDAGVGPPADASAAPTAPPVPEPPAAACAAQCEGGWATCKQSCAGAACDKCAVTYKRCMRKCF